MPKSENQGRDLVLESRQLMAVFLGISVLCGVFFALGYVVGVHTAPAESAAQPAVRLASSPEKPSALPSASYIPRNPAASAPADANGSSAAAPGTGSSAPPSDSDLSFYQNVQQNSPQPALNAAAPAVNSAQSTPVNVVPPPPGILVQVSALSKREDAESLVALLKDKNLPVLVTAGDNDSLFHVVIGPYKTDAEAESVKQALEQEGFRPFIRH